MHKLSSLQMCVSVSVPSNANPQISQNSDWTLNKILLTGSVSKVDSYFLDTYFSVSCRLVWSSSLCSLIFLIVPVLFSYSCLDPPPYFVIVFPVRMWSVNDILHLWVFEYFFPVFHCFSPCITKVGGKELKVQWV